MTLSEAREKLAALESILSGATGSLRSVTFADRTVSYQDKSDADIRAEVDRLRRDIARHDGKPSRSVSRFNLNYTP